MAAAGGGGRVKVETMWHIIDSLYYSCAECVSVSLLGAGGGRGPSKLQNIIIIYRVEVNNIQNVLFYGEEGELQHVH